MASVSQQSVAPGLAVGLEIERRSLAAHRARLVGTRILPKTFAKSEIAYVAMEADPCTHLASFSCDKEALRKCNPGFGALAMFSTMVAHDPRGCPYLVSEASNGRIGIGYALNISHTDEIAAAGRPSPGTVPGELPATPPPLRPRLGLVSALLMIAVAAAALVAVQPFH
jgi:phosphopantetheinyl transferase (holo-ACP synthase)